MKHSANDNAQQHSLPASSEVRSALNIGTWTMDELLESYPGAAEILAEHGVDPRTRCNHGVRHYLKLRQVLGRNCPIDDPRATLADLEAFIAAPAREA